MQTTLFALGFPTLAAFACLSIGASTPASAQVTDAERAGARELFKAGDQLQRSGHFAEALDKFQRAQQVFAAPTNVLRVAECDAALGRLVESAEAYRDVLRTVLPPGAPPAFQAAVDQAKAELSQVEPRVPRLVIQIQPPDAPNPQLQIDGQSVPGALIGEPMPLDPGTHKVAVVASGYSSAEQAVELREHDARTVSFALNASPSAGPVPALSTAPSSGPTDGEVTSATPPPPPAIQATDFGFQSPRRSSVGFLMGAHLGFEGSSGLVPTPDASGFVSPSSVGGGGFAFGIDGGFRFARLWYLGLALSRANFSGANVSQLNDATVTSASSNTTLLALVAAFVANPDRVSFYAELGLGERWYDVRERRATGDSSQLFNAGEFALGVGIWIPVGRSFRLLPKVTFGFDSFSDDTSNAATTSSTTADAGTNKLATFTTLSLVGLYNLDL